MEFSGKMYIKIILKVTKNQGFTLFLEDTFFKKPQREESIPCFAHNNTGQIIILMI